MKRKKFWKLFCVMGFIGISTGLFSILCCSVSPFEQYNTMSAGNAFLMGYLPCQFIYVPFYFAIKKSNLKTIA